MSFSAPAPQLDCVTVTRPGCLQCKPSTCALRENLSFQVRQMGGTPGGQSPLNRAGMHVNHESSKRWLGTTSLAQTWDVGNEREERCCVTGCGQKWPFLPSLSRGHPPSPAVLSSEASREDVIACPAPSVCYPGSQGHVSNTSEPCAETDCRIF